MTRLIIFLIGVGLLVTAAGEGIHLYADAQDLQKRGTNVDARVLKNAKAFPVAKNFRVLEVEYEAEGRTLHATLAPTGFASLDRIFGPQRGDTVLLVVDPSDPAHATTASGLTAAGRWAYFPWMLAALGIGMLLLARSPVGPQPKSTIVLQQVERANETYSSRIRGASITSRGYDRATVDELAAAVDEVLTDPHSQKRRDELAVQIAATPLPVVMRGYDRAHVDRVMAMMRAELQQSPPA